jgi:hypothetical protein
VDHPQIEQLFQEFDDGHYPLLRGLSH